MPGHGHGNGHVDAHHAHLNATRELAGHIAIAGEAGHAVAEFVGVDQLHGRAEIGHPHATQHGAEDLFLVDAHRGRHVVEQRAAGEEAVLMPRHLEAPAVHHQLRALFHAELDVALDAVARLAGDDGAHLGVELHAVLDLQGARPFGQLGDDLVGHIAHQHRH